MGRRSYRQFVGLAIELGAMSNVLSSSDYLNRTKMRLTLSYVAIMMSVSLVFSVFFYITSVTALHVSGSTHLLATSVPKGVGQLPRLPSPTALLRTETTAIEHRLFIRLIFLNGTVFFIGSSACYYLARKTLRPVEMIWELQEQFISDASHELKTPVAGLRLRGEVALRDPALSLSEARATIEANVKQALVLEALTSSLLELAREQNLQKAPMAEVPLDAVVTAAVEQCHDAARAKSISIISDLSPLTVRAARKQLEQVVVILLDNAIKFSDVDSTVYVSSVASKDDAVIIVRDEGQGIRDVDIPHIFERFYQVDGSRAKQGYGLGLSIADNIIRRHHGKITVKSVLGRGSEFSVYIPCAMSA